MKLFDVGKFTQLFRKDYLTPLKRVRIASHLKNGLAKKLVCIMRDDGFRDKIERK